MNPGDIVRSSNNEYKVIKELGSGGQGVVYLVQNRQGQKFALKWYHKFSQVQFKKIGDLYQGLKSKKYEPLRTDKDFIYLLPLDIVRMDKGTSFGYIMDLLDISKFENSVMVKTRKTPICYDKLCDYSINLGKAYNSLHSRGLCYQDVNKDNMYFNPKTGKVHILDIDNITTSDLDTKGEVIGTPGFIAPEIFSGKSSPNSTTDKFSLTVMLFNMWACFEPFEGRYYFDSELQFLADEGFSDRFYSNPLFIFHPTNNKNGVEKSPKVEPGLYSWVNYYWSATPPEIKDAFTQTFVDSINDTNKRLPMSAWIRIFKKIKSELVQCKHCGKYNTHAMLGQEAVCMHCDKKVKNYKPQAVTTQVRTLSGSTTNAAPARTLQSAPVNVTPPPVAVATPAPAPAMTHTNSIVVYESGTEVAVLKVKKNTSFTGAEVSQRLKTLKEVFDLIPHPKDERRIAIRNKSGYNWDVYSKSGGKVLLEKGKSVGIDMISHAILPADIKLVIEL